MYRCHFYQVHTITFRSNEIRSDRQSVPVSDAHSPWCSHKHSPATKHFVTGLGGGDILQCAGKLTRCQVPRDKVGDVDTSVE